MEKETAIANEAEVLSGENTVIIESGDGRLGSCDILVNCTKQTFETGKEITVSDAQLDVLRNSNHKVEEVAVSKKSKATGSSDGEAGVGEGSPTPAAKGKGKAAAKSAPTTTAKAKPEPASNVDNGGNTTTSEAVKQAGSDATS